MFFLKLGELVRGDHICNLFGQIWPLATTEIKKNCAVIRGKNLEELHILKLQYLDFPDSFSDDLFFHLGCFYKRNSYLQPVSTKCSQKYAKNFWYVVTLVFLLRKKQKSTKMKKYLPTMSAKESALIPLVNNLNRYKNIITTNTEYTIDPLSKIE
jgi:hypothetical protein